MTTQEKQVALKFQVEDLPTICRLHALTELIENYFIRAIAINSQSLYGHHNNKHQLQMRCVKIKKEQTTGSDVYNRRRQRIHHFLEQSLHTCIMLQRINHSYPVSSCIYHQRPGCSSSLAQEDDQTRRSRQYPVQAAGGGIGFWGDADRPFTGLLCSVCVRACVCGGGGIFITFVIQ